MAFFVHSQIISAQSENPRFSIGVEAQLMIAGEMNASFDYLTGVRFSYSFNTQKKIRPFISSSFATDIGTNHARLISTDIQYGALLMLGKRFSLLASLGGDFTAESHSFSLDGKPKTWNDYNLRLRGVLGLRYSVTSSLSFIINIKQTNLNSTTIGLGLNFSF